MYGFTPGNPFAPFNLCKHDFQADQEANYWPVNIEKLTAGP